MDIQECADKAFNGAIVVEQHLGKVIVKRKKPLYEDKPYIVSHHKAGSFFWSTYDLNLEDAIELLYY